MKVKIEIDTDAQEMREFFGLPDVRPLQKKMLADIQHKLRNGVTGFDALNLMKPLFPAQMQSLEAFQKTFWEAFQSGAAGVADSAASGKHEDADDDADDDAAGGDDGDGDGGAVDEAPAGNDAGRRSRTKRRRTA